MRARIHERKLPDAQGPLSAHQSALSLFFYILW